jgi:pyruvate/2-oxoglutarate dehydrogenase complex dihydrolipoamide dehydrogenase (E3) component
MAGHQVEVWEKESVPGGQAYLAEIPPHKEDVRAVFDYRWEQVKALEVPVKTDVTATSDDIRRYDPDYVVVATGAEPKRLPAKLVAENGEWFQAWEVLRDPSLLDGAKRVTILGGGLVGVETAEAIADLGIGVHIVEMLDSIATGYARNNRADALEILRSAGVTWDTGVLVESFQGNTIVYTRDGQKSELNIGDALVLAIGPSPETSAAAMLQELDVPYVLVGDCNQPGDFLTALRDASLSAIAVNRALNEEEEIA